MRGIIISGVMLGSACLAMPSVATAQSLDRGVQARRVAGQTIAQPQRTLHRWGPRVNGHWLAGAQAPGGWSAYRRPVVGFILPRYWIQPTYFIGNYGSYGLPAPAEGYGWSRYYDDAVLTDRYGRVIDSRHGIAWDRYDGGYDDGPDAYDVAERRDDGVGGAVIGGVAGGLVGNRIAGRENRTAGTLVGAGVGAIAGAAIDRAEDSHASVRSAAPHARRHDDDDRVTYNNEYDGRWVGTWYGDDGTSYSGEYRGRYEGTVPPPRDPHWAAASNVDQYGGYFANGYYYPGPTVTTIVVQPATTTSYVTEDVIYPARIRSSKVRRSQSTVRCNCR
ncbi:RcnB family protein [Sphingobium sp. H39-3-25]|nr:RcnB family protein [Sphingobium arseniciresistens]